VRLTVRNGGYRTRQGVDADGLLRPEGHVEKTAVLEVIEGVRVDEKGD